MKIPAPRSWWPYVGPWGAALMIVAAVAVVSIGLLVAGVDGAFTLFALGMVVSSPLAAGLCAGTAVAVGGRERLAWGFMSAAYGATTLSICVAVAYLVAAGSEPPTASWIGGLWLLYYPFAAAAVFVLVGPAGSGPVRATTFLDAGALSLATGAFVWEVARVSMGSPGVLSSGPGIMAVAYLIGDLLVMFALIALGLRWHAGWPSRPLSLLVTTLMLALVVDFAFLGMVLEGVSLVTGPSTVVWLVMPVVVGWAAVARLGGWSRRSAPPETCALVPVGEPSAGGSSRPASEVDVLGGVISPGRFDRLRGAAPYATFPLVVGFMVLYFSRARPPGHTGTVAAVWFAVTVLGLVSLRQSLTLRENGRLAASLLELSHDLEQRVERRTVELREQSRSLAERTEQITAMNRVALQLSRALTSDQVVTTGLTLAFEATGCSAGVVWLRAPGRDGHGDGAVELAARYGLPPEVERLLVALPDTEPAFNRVLCAEQALLLRSTATASLGRLASADADRDWGLYLVPLVSRGDALGVMGLVLADADSLDETGRQLTRSIATQLAVTLENARQYDRVAFLADHDPVTGLLNHRALHTRLDEELNRAQRSGGRFSILMIDVDNFKLFNDTYGHQVGDRVLERMAELLRATVRGSDVVGRYGGDEFMALLPDTDAAGAVDVAERLQDSLYDAPFSAPDGVPVPLLCSVGIATYPDDARRTDELVGMADANLYTSKQQGGGTITAAPPPGRVDPQPAGVFTVLDGLVTAVDNKDRYTRSHSDGVTQLALAIADRIGLGDEHRRALRLAGLLHDVGKIGVPDRILRKPGRLTSEEYEVVKQHAALSELIIKEIPHLDLVVSAVGAHHERFDGGGYPRGLKGDGIPLLGRILAVADAYSAMTTDRPYRKAMTPEDACADLVRVAGTQLDPDLVQAFMQVVDVGGTAAGGARATGKATVG